MTRIAASIFVLGGLAYLLWLSVNGAGFNAWFAYSAAIATLGFGVALIRRPSRPAKIGATLCAAIIAVLGGGVVYELANPYAGLPWDAIPPITRPYIESFALVCIAFASAACLLLLDKSNAP